MIEVLQKRKTTFRNQCLKYSRYVFNDHFVLFLLIFLGFLAVQYSQFLRSLPEDKSLLLIVLALAPLLLLPIGSIATYFEKPDMIFLLAKEEELKGYLNQPNLTSDYFLGNCTNPCACPICPFGFGFRTVSYYCSGLFGYSLLVEGSCFSREGEKIL